VYRLYAPDGTLLYIGSSYNPDKRCEVHRRSPWWGEVGRRTEEWFPNRSLAYTAETNAIWSEKPKHNVACTNEYNARRSDEAKAQAHLYRRRARASVLKNAARSAATPDLLSLWNGRSPIGPALDALARLRKVHTEAGADPASVAERYVVRAEQAAVEMVPHLLGLDWPKRCARYKALHQRLADLLRDEGAVDEEIATVMGVVTLLVGERVDLLADAAAE
jgi:hypothetical protein